MALLQTGDQALLRKLNLSSVLRLIQAQECISRAGLASLTQLNKSTISSLVDELTERGLLCEAGQGLSGGGRPATHLKLNPHAGYVIGIDLGVESIDLAAADFTGQVLQRLSQATSPAQSQEDTLHSLLELADQLLTSPDFRQARLLGIGVTVPGMVNIQTGELIFSPNLRWRGLALGPLVAQHTGAAVLVDNDANASAVAEHLFGAARRTGNFIFITAGVGVGGGLYLNDELYRGAGGFAGEIGHTGLALGQSQPCRCGNTGCWENITNQYALVERVRARLEVGRQSLLNTWLAESPQPLSLELITQAAEAGDAVALDALYETGQMIGLKIANLVNIFNPEMVVIGGAMSLAGAYLLPAIRAMVAQRSLPESQHGLQVTLSAFGTAANVQGAVALVIKSILDDPTQAARLTELPGKAVSTLVNHPYVHSKSSCV